MESVLPRIKSKRKKRKPPGPSFWYALWNVCAAIIAVVINIAIFNQVPPWYRCFTIVLSAAWLIALKVWFWPEFIEELEAWKNDDR